MNKFVFLSVIAISMLMPTQAQIEMNSSGTVGIGTAPSSSYNLKVANNLLVPTIYIDNLYKKSPIAGSITFTLGSLKLMHPTYPMYKTSLGINMTPSSSYALDVNGSARCTQGYWHTSDQIYKKNIETINGKTALDMLLQVQGRTYEYKTRDELLSLYQSGELKLTVDTISVMEKDENDQDVMVEKVQIEVPDLLEGNNYGFIAQEIEGVLPELVSFDSILGTYSIQYDGFIPIMLEAIKQQQTEIEDLKQQIAGISSLKSAAIANTSSNLDTNQQPTTLFQNAPNPFSEETKIRYYLEDQVNTATLYIYDMNGKQLRSYDLHHKKEGEITINSGELEAGMYMYSLIADRQVKGTKQMVLTD
ncbi:MAG: hypothetical protein DRQ40_09565 [Gammaproteobacteria bacterium]|nr:MAG: hypothetical protein DRQ40_09565 [Gammaproteobacteria bacterium]